MTEQIHAYVDQLANAVKLAGVAIIVGGIVLATWWFMLANLPYLKLRDAVITHPTVAEGLGPLLSNVPGSRESLKPGLTPARTED